MSRLSLLSYAPNDITNYIPYIYQNECVEW